VVGDSVRRADFGGELEEKFLSKCLACEQMFFQKRLAERRVVFCSWVSPTETPSNIGWEQSPRAGLSLVIF
jgi:hypothetical protein